MDKVRIPRKKKKFRYIARVLRGRHFPNVPKIERYLMYLQIEYAMKRYNDTAERLYHRFGFVLKDHIVWYHWVRKMYLGIEPQMSEEFQEYWNYFVEKGVIK